MNDCVQIYENELIGGLTDEEAKRGKKRQLISTKVDRDD
jgi:hypothetical protein